MRVRAVAAGVLGAFVLLVAASAAAQGVAGRAAKRAVKDAAESEVKDAAGDAAKGAVKKAMAPDAVDLNSATPEQLTKLGFDEATQKKLVAGRPYTGLDDAKLTEAVPADVLKKLEGKVLVKTAK